MLCHRIVQLQLALLVGQCEERGIEDLADRPEIEQDIGGDRLGPVGHAIIEERSSPIRPNGHGRAARTGLLQCGANVLGYDLRYAVIGATVRHNCYGHN